MSNNIERRIKTFEKLTTTENPRSLNEADADIIKASAESLTALAGRSLNEAQANNNKEGEKLKGYSILYNSLSEPLYGDSFREIIKKGAFLKSLKEDDQVCLWGHDTRYVLGRKSAGTLILREDEKGLYFEVLLPNTSWALDLKESVNRGDINKMSFGFKTIKDNWINDKKTLKEYGMPIREVEEIVLHEISLVTFPAYSQTNVREYNESVYIPKPPKDPINDNYIKYSARKIRYLKIKNKLKNPPELIY